MDKIILNFKLLEVNNISINEFLCLLKIYFSNDDVDINYEDLYHNYQSLENKKYIKITIEIVEDEKRIKYTLREKAKLILETSFNDYDKVSITKKRNVSDKYIDRLVSDKVKDYRQLFKATNKRGAIGSPEGCKSKLKRWMKNNPEYTFDDILKATKLYIQELNGDYRFLQQADYFIYKKGGGRDELSRLSTYVEEVGDANFVEEGWANGEII